MKIFLALMMAASPAAAWGPAESAAAERLLTAKAEVEVIGGAPLLDLLAARDKASLPLELAGRKFFATVNFDDNWDAWFTLKPASGPGAGAWKEADLAAGAVYRYDGLVLRLKETGGVVSIEGPQGARADVAVNSLFDRLYAESARVTFGGIVTYAVFRNIEPLTEREGTVTLRVGSDGLYYFSVTRDSLIEAAPRWLLAVNGVLYGLRVQDGSLLFVSKVIDMNKPVPALQGEAVRSR